MIASRHRRSFDTTSWVSLRFERGSRFYRLHLEQDLWGDWALTRVNGRSGTPLGHYCTTWRGSLENGLLTLAAAAKRRRLRGYELAS